MRIEELVLEGFKSYPVRTQITGWDASFNAITGLNGSGKSNILDAICFVLGMTNVTQMRASNQQDLIYKRGQAGITKASVTVVFDNSDRDTSPVGFENCKQITVTRQISLPANSKYLLNGHKTNQTIIHNLFQGVQLNINNPNFLIMQGRITKVLNMRPQEILGMVEEAAGTRMFEERKDKAKKTMDKKEKRVEEITALLSEEITPKLDKLRADQRSYLAYQKTSTELERLGRLVRAWEWKEACDRVKRKEADVEKKNRELARVKEERKAREEEGKQAEKQKKEVEKKRDEELKKGGKFKKREEEVKELEKEVVKFKTQIEIKEGSIKDETTKLEALAQAAVDNEKAVEAKKVHLEECTVSHATVSESFNAAQTKLNNADSLLQSLQTGLSASNTNSGAGGGYLGQLSSAKQRLSQESAEEEQFRRKIAMKERELKALEERWKGVENEMEDQKQRVERGEREIEELKHAIERSGWDDEKIRESDEKLREAKIAVRNLAERRDNLRQGLGALDFSYSPPSPNFNHSSVKGLVASLITLDEEHFDKSAALEIAAGGRLYNVVVENEKVGKDLLERGQLKKRVTIIPLNKINAFKASAAKLQAAHQLAGEKVNLALSLVGYEKDVSAAMSFVFGDTLICADSATAQKVTFHPQIQMKSVTLQGDVYDPSGTLSGGAPPQSSGLLVRVKELKEAETEVANAKANLARLEKEDEKVAQGKELWRTKKRDLEVKMHEVNLLREQLQGSNASRVKMEIDDTIKMTKDLKESIAKSKEKQKEAEEEIAKLKVDMEDFKNNKDGKIAELKADIAKQKIELNKQSVGLKMHQKELQTAKLELEGLERDVVDSHRRLDEAKASIQRIKEEIEQVTKDLKAVEAKHQKAEQKLQEERATLTRFDTEIDELEQVIKEKQQASSDAELSIKKIDHEIQSLQKDRTTSVNAVATLEKAYEWIAEEKKNFGKPGGRFDFDNSNMGEIRDKCKLLEQQQKGMKKSINQGVLSTLQTVEKRETELKKNLSIVLADKEKIVETIAELDRYKRDALMKTWEKVSSDFGDIFAELLPGNFAKLQPPEGQDLTEGLEVKVQLGQVWKQSLTELSGGQRSLIALSLIMSLLQFKPAPMYILDEIDAALDLSHTQHIGQLFRTRFKGSQFIVVSLKEGLFTNANVLFRARFIDGTSVVQRTAQRSGSALYNSGSGQTRDKAADKENQRADAQTPARGKGNRAHARQRSQASVTSS
ncbi:condensin complex subunit SMC2 [Sistotremastrum suecicum HHB10207 ss-3]|uniref:Structural maintenance of chromosomes protein n=1 Tax=Sistotremastrum suecicum HHB10207 ss-3 TaxID=1314776 RepID=A0A165ZB90_9AGAM|nr:condensin complex subunit SMC2 [Sistotremastrum suecicum HHB10207 ss-3]